MRESKQRDFCVLKQTVKEQDKEGKVDEETKSFKSFFLPIFPFFLGRIRGPLQD